MSVREFSADLRILKLGGCHVILGVDWMKKIGPLVFDFNTLEVTFNWEGQQVTLDGSQETKECKAVSGKRIQKLLEHGSTIVG